MRQLVGMYGEGEAFGEQALLNDMVSFVMTL